MSPNQSYSSEIQIATSPAQVYTAITLHINAWWTTRANEASQVGDQLTVRFEEGTSWQMEVTSAEPERLLAWHVTEAIHNLTSLSKSDEWEGTTIVWEISAASEGSHVTFTHNGLVPSLECYDICEQGWDYFLGSLKQFLETGTGSPFKP
ncbi:MAG: SRPBCC domain-containing protein [Bacteroidota bacterium]